MAPDELDDGVRPATPADAPRLRELSAQLLTELLARRGGPLLFESDPWATDGSGLADRVAAAVGDPDRLVIVGTLDEAVSGFACGRVAERGGRGCHGHLDACYVEPEGRGVGIGHLLLEALLAWFESRGAVGVDGIALPGDRSAKNFFESAGFKARMLTMHRALD